jgi:hypothetical protein
MQMTLNSLSVKLKISPSGNLKRNAGILNEREPEISGDGSNVLLFGGGGPAKF